MHFKYNTRNGKAWTTDGLIKVLRERYPGAKTLTEALSMEIKARQEQGIEGLPDCPAHIDTPLTQSSREIKPRLPYKESDEEIDF